jgi:flagellar protein FliO/FliZ
MWEILSLILLVVLVAAAIVAGALLWRNYIDSGAPGSGMFKAKTEKRLDVVEQSVLDGRRKLVLIRRDNKEHLIMTGGPVDVVIETGIDTSAEILKRSRSSGEVVEAPVFSRPARKMGQAAGEA